MVQGWAECDSENILLSSPFPPAGLRCSGRTQKQVLDYVKEGGERKGVNEMWEKRQCCF